LTGTTIYTKSLISRNHRAGRAVDFRGGEYCRGRLLAHRTDLGRRHRLRPRWRFVDLATDVRCPYSCGCSGAPFI